MISISEKKWVEQKVNKNLVEKIKQDFNFNEILSRLIIIRNFNNTEINNIKNPLKINNIFYKNQDFIKAANILLNTINKKENICIFGDYDVDGASSTALLIRYFNYIKHPHFYYIPDREKDGYGPSKQLFKKLILKKPKLIIMVDCGSTSFEAIEFLNQNNIKSIIIDHHEINKPYPKSDVIINPKKIINYNGYDYLCASSLTYFFIYIIIKKTQSKFELSNYLIYVLLATICDVMPLRKFNKIIASHVIKNFKLEDNLAFKTIFKKFNLKKKLNIDDLGFLIGPIINSGGRLGYSTYGTELLSSDNLSTIEKKTIKLINLNEKRKKIEKNILREINFDKICDNKNVIIYYNKNIHEGLIGIIAARLKDHFNRPAIVLTKSNKILKASARSTKIYNIGKIIKKLVDINIIEKGGGHNMAAGFTIKKEKMSLLDDFIQNDYKKNVSILKLEYVYDAEISPSAINLNFFYEINKLGPFGAENRNPIFLIKNLKIIKIKVLNNKHISLILKPKIGSSINSIYFNSLNKKVFNFLLSYNKTINVIGQIGINEWNNKKTIQLVISDIII